VTQATEIISPQTDIDLFISNNKSGNCNISKEEFQLYNTDDFSKKFRQSELDAL